MRLRALATTTALASGALLAPFAAAPAAAVTPAAPVVAYTADANGNERYEMYVRPADGSGSPTRLFYSDKHVALPSLSPDGSKIAYLEMDPVLQSFKLLVRTMNPVGPPVLVAPDQVTASVGWSPDGTRLVYSWLDDDSRAFGTYIANADGSGVPTLVPTTDTVWAEEPSFSPSGRQVAVDAFTKDGEYAGIDLITLATGTRARLVGTAGGSDPVWSPDGRTILFQVWEDPCSVALYSIPAGGGTRTLVRKVGNRFLGSAEYSRDGAQLFWAEADLWCADTGPGEVWYGNADGTGAAKVAATPIDESSTSVAGGPPAPADTTAPDAPVIGTAGTVTASSVKVSWTAAGDATEFVVLRKEHGAPAPVSPTDGTVVYHGAARSATATGLALDSVHDLYVFAIDAHGNVSAASAAHAARTLPVPVMHGIGRIGTVNPTPTFPVAWTGTGTSFELMAGQRTRSSSGTWSATPAYALFAGTGATSATFTGTQGRTHYFKARALDEFGNATPYAATPSKANVPINEDWGGFSTSTGWTAKTGGDHYLDTYRTTVASGRTMSARVDTSQFVVIGDKCATCGRVEVWVDGVKRTTVDTKASTTLTRQVLYAGHSLGAVAPHSIRLVTVDPNRRVSIDGVALSR
jgi:hypothetical protein